MTLLRSAPLRPGAARALCLSALLLASVGLAPAAAHAQTEGPCIDAPTNVCLDDGRFEVTVEWKDFTPNPFFLPSLTEADQGQGQGVKLQVTSNIVSTGYFWFFDEDAVDLVVKVIDGRDVNGHFWVFAGSLTNVEYTLRVIDTQTDRQTMYVNDPGERSVIGDTGAFEDDGGTGGTGGSQAVGVLRRSLLPKEELPSCGDDGVTCVRDRRFAVESTFRNESSPGGARTGRASLVTDTSALLYYFDDPENPFTFVKVDDGREVNGSFWVSGAVLVGSRPGVEIRVTDLETGKSATYAAVDEKAFAFGDRQPFAPDPPAGPWLETAEIPDFRFKARVVGGNGEVPVRQESECIPETLCISGALPGRSELFLRMVGPKPNGFLWPNIVKFSTSQIEIWAEQLSSGVVNYYLLDGAGPGSDELTGLFDRTGFTP
jgi:hypothetical protein